MEAGSGDREHRGCFMKLKSIKLNTAIESILPLAALLIGLLLMVLRPSNVSQASLPSPMRQSFVGEYSWDKENWFELDDQVFLSAFDGDLYLRGH